MSKKPVRKSVREVVENVCLRCGYGPGKHTLVNYADGPHIGESALVCPTAIYKTHADVVKERAKILGGDPV